LQDIAMRIAPPAACLATTLICLSTVLGHQLPDAQLEKLLVGKWQHTDSPTKAFTEYRDDGTFVGDGSIEQLGELVKIRVWGRWKIEDGAVVEVIDKCQPAGIPIGTTLYDSVLQLNAKTFRYRTEQGIERAKTRLLD